MSEVPLPVAPIPKDDPKKKDAEKPKDDGKAVKPNGDAKEGEAEEFVGISYTLDIWELILWFSRRKTSS